MDLWLIILLSAVGGLLLLVFIVLTVWMLCRRRKRSSLLKTYERQNGNVWQAHDYVVEVDDEELPSERLDGLCKDTISGSTFPRRSKIDEGKSEPEEDGLCKDTKIRSTSFPRRSKLKDTWLKPVENGGHSVSETALKSALPVGALVTTLDTSKPDQLNQPVKEKSKVDDVTLYNANGDAITHDNDDDTSSLSSDESKDNRPTKTENSNRRKLSMERKRSKSFGMDLDEVLEYTKPVKRAFSNPSIVVRQKIIKADERFQNLDTWKESFPLPEPDYHSDRDLPSVSRQTNNVHFPPLNASGDSGVDIIQSVSGHESETQPDSVTEYSQAINTQQMTTTDNGEGSFLLKELPSFINVETKDRTATDEEKNNHIPVSINSHDSPTATVEQETKPLRDEVAVGIPNNSITVETETHEFLQHQSTKIATESKQTTSSWETQPVDFKSVQLKPPTWKNYDASQDIPPVTRTALTEDSDAKRILPSSLIAESQSSKQAHQPATDSSKVTSKSSTTKKNTVSYKTTGTHSEFTTNNQVDFRAFKLRPTPDDIKQHIGFKERPSNQIDLEIPGKDSGNVEKIDKSPITTSTRDQGLRGSNLLSHLTNSRTGENPSPIQTTSVKANGTIASKSSTDNNLDMTIIRMDEKEERQTLENSNESNELAPKRQTALLSADDRRRNWRREQIEQRLSTSLIINERQPIIQASGLAYRSCMPELFTKIKEIGDQKENVTTK